MPSVGSRRLGEVSSWRHPRLPDPERITLGRPARLMVACHRAGDCPEPELGIETEHAGADQPNVKQ
jgi:hypothetical protein